MSVDSSTFYSFKYKLRVWFRVARAAGIDIDRFLASKGVTEKQLLETGRRVPRRQVIEWVAELIERIGDPEIGLRLAECCKLTDADLLGYLVQNCPHPLAAMRELSTYSSLVIDTLQLKIESDRGTVALVVETLDARKINRFEADACVGLLSRAISKLTSGTIYPVAVHLDRPHPLNPDNYRNFFGAPVTFDAECCALYYTESDLRTPIKGSDPRLRELLQERADALLAESPVISSFVEHVRVYVVRRIEYGKEFSIETTAREFGMSERTFGRRLREEGCNYRELIEKVKRDQALDLAHNSEENVTAIAHRVGFSDSTTFGRAFRRWTGQSPIEYFKKVREPGARNSSGFFYDNRIE